MFKVIIGGHLIGQYESFAAALYAFFSAVKLPAPDSAITIAEFGENNFIAHITWDGVTCQLDYLEASDLAEAIYNTEGCRVLVDAKTPMSPREIDEIIFQRYIQRFFEH